MSAFTAVTRRLDTPGTLLYREESDATPLITLHVRSSRRDPRPPAAPAAAAANDLPVVRITQKSTGLHFFVTSCDDDLSMNLKFEDELWIASDDPEACIAWVTW